MGESIYKHIVHIFFLTETMLQLDLINTSLITHDYSFVHAHNIFLYGLERGKRVYRQYLQKWRLGLYLQGCKSISNFSVIVMTFKMKILNPI